MAEALTQALTHLGRRLFVVVVVAAVAVAIAIFGHLGAGFVFLVVVVASVLAAVWPAIKKSG